MYVDVTKPYFFFFYSFSEDEEQELLRVTVTSGSLVCQEQGVSPSRRKEAGDRALCGAGGTRPLSRWGQRTCRQAPAAGAGGGFPAFPYQHGRGVQS